MSILLTIFFQCVALSSRFARTSLELGPLEIIHFLFKAWNIKPNFHEVLCYSFLFCFNQTNNLRLDFMIRFHYLPEVTFNKERRFWSGFLMFRVNTQDGSMETFFQLHWQAWNPRSKQLFLMRFSFGVSWPGSLFSSVRMHRNDATKHNLNISQPLSTTYSEVKNNEIFLEGETIKL